ncbi:hypothetical protein PMSD_06465 [Paenibacillus macquariensis subsp. defensor]|nr:hypothetical protein PMSD_06465 [Paenibacillus macquariensis subsp. defensor]
MRKSNITIPLEGFTINLKPRKSLLLLLVINLLQFIISVTWLVIGYLPFDFIFFLIAFTFGSLFIVLTIDLFSKKRRIVRGRIINKEGKMINVLRDDGKLKKFKIVVPEVLELLSADQRVEISSTNLGNIPCVIQHIE